jgi:hypothetical protein
MGSTVPLGGVLKGLVLEGLVLEGLVLFNAGTAVMVAVHSGATAEAMLCHF